MGTVKKSIEASSPMWLSRKDLQFCEGGFLLFGSRRETIRSEISIPSFHSYPCILGATQSGLEVAILQINCCISRSVPGLPGRFCLDSRVQ